MPGSGPALRSDLVAALAARDPHHKGKGKKNQRRQDELTDAEDDAHWADLHVRDPEPHHKGKGKKNQRREPEPHHKGKGKKEPAS
ncbi:hypothetical protein N0V83_009298 [Neocucurbitaria cava]|uniref:Uncharacterized protein n=1 Tax=Neocucurbitaria cava TaxID=798079 RepID=A0A9W8Y2G1_9PLEO|nr:hypothetical protein N0V83_009298 [Neocucurbitaria cava]